MTTIALLDTRSQTIVAIDNASYVLRVEHNNTMKEARLKPFMASVLWAIFEHHPTPLSYDQLTEILRQHGLVVADLTRMHRKVSEIRQAIQAIHPCLENLILNTRGMGYALPIQFKSLHQGTQSVDAIKFSHPRIARALQTMEALVNDAIQMTTQAKIVKHHWGYMTDREPWRDRIAALIASFKDSVDMIWQELRLHEADFLALRIHDLLARLKTYVGLARLSEYPISDAQWHDWFKTEITQLFETLKKLIRDAESA